VLAALPIRDTGQHSRGGGEGATEASTRKIVREVRLSVLLAGSTGDIATGIE
jgi:hypothetical protein